MQDQCLWHLQGQGRTLAYWNAELGQGLKSLLEAEAEAKAESVLRGVLEARLKVKPGGLEKAQDLTCKEAGSE